MKEIESRHNAKFKRWLGLLDSKGIKKERRALVSGEKLVRELIDQSPDLVEEILIPPKSDFLPAALSVTRLSSPLFKELDVIGTHRPLAVVRTPELPEWAHEPPCGLEVIVALSDPANLGACLRSAEAFGAKRVILTRECSSPFLPKAIKAASMSTFRVRLFVTGSIQEIKLNEGFGLHMSGEDISRFEWPRDTYLVLGEEGRGLPEHLPVKRLRVPMKPGCESLNATTAVSLALFSYRLKYPL